ncbi:hypothetical protein EJB05_40967, partial [Eragrostis curvula]
MPDGRTKKLRKSMCSEEQVAAADHASASPPRKIKKKKQKMKSQMMAEEEAVAAVACASTSRRKKKSEKPKESKWKVKEGMADEEKEKKQDEAEEEEKPSSLYLVVRHAVIMAPAYSLFEVRHTQKSAEHPVPFPYRLQYLNGQHDMSFVAGRDITTAFVDRRGRWLRIGRPGAELTTIVYDCKTGTVGPCLTESKYSPVVVAVGEKVYALTRMPAMSMLPEFPPLFEVLDLSGASSCVDDGRLINCAWRPLPFTSLFDDVMEGWSRVDRAPAEAESYAVVAQRYILLSIAKDPFSPRQAGTVAFDVFAEEWLYLDQNNLPFVGQAVPYGRLFLGRPKSKDSNNNLTAYDISVSLAAETNTLTMSVAEVPIAVGMTDGPPLRPGQFFASLGNGVICTVGCWTEGWTGDEELVRDGIYFNFHTPIVCSDDEQGKIVLSGSPSKYFFRLHEPGYRLLAPSLVAAPCLTVI